MIAHKRLICAPVSLGSLHLPTLMLAGEYLFEICTHGWTEIGGGVGNCHG